MNHFGLNRQQLAGQRLMVGFDGTAFNEDLRFLIRTLNVGGIILFSRNIVEPEQLRELCKAIQRCGRNAGIPPLFIAIDQEGGEVARLKKPFAQLPGASEIKDEDAVSEFARTTAAELIAAGVNMNMAPVMDVAPLEIRSIMASRSYGPDPDRVARMGCRLIEDLQSRNIMAVAKHFPGIGRTVLDSHEDMPTLQIDLETLQKSDLVPFAAAVDRQVAGIMLSHIFYEQIDPDWPASLSPLIAGDLLRKVVKYDGVVMTDDLDMGAIKKHYDLRTAMHQILAADIDIALLCHKSPDIENAHEEAVRQMTDSKIIRQKGIAAVERILNLKNHYLTNR